MKLTRKNIMILLLFPLYLLYVLVFLEAIGYPPDIWDKISKWVKNKSRDN